MAENQPSDRRRKGQINPERVALASIVDCAKVLFSFAKGGSNFIKTLDWTITSYAGVRGAVNLIHHPGNRELGEYAFNIRSLSDAIMMENADRRARQGSGVTAFSDMEHMGSALATLANRNVHMIYPLFGQADTERFLSARGYTSTLVESTDPQSPLPALEKILPPIRR